MCPSMWAHWRHLANSIEFVLLSAHRSPPPKRQIDRFSRFCTAHGRKFLYFRIGDTFPATVPSRWGHLDPHLTHDSLDLGPIRADNPNDIWIGSAVFAHITAECHYRPTLQWDAPSPLKITHSHGGSGPHLIHGSLGPPESSNQAASRSVLV